MGRSSQSVLVLAGGFSPERNVSFASAANVAANLRLRRYHVEVADLCGGILTPGEEQFYLDAPIQGEVTPKELENLEESTDIFAFFQSQIVKRADVIFPVIHGTFGEDGRLQAMLDMCKIPYVGSGFVGQALAMNKHIAKQLFVFGGIPTAPWIQVVKDGSFITPIKFPVIVKPANGGSSVGIRLCEDPRSLDHVLTQAFQYDTRVIVEQHIRGREFTVGVLDGQALAVGEIRSKAALFDYQAKYQATQTEEIFPVALSTPLTERVKSLVLKVNEVLQLRHYSRVDLIIDDDDQIFILEANGLPGVTKRSLFPQSARAAGWTFDAVCDQLCQLAVRDYMRAR